MKCEDIFDKTDEYLDGLLSLSEEEQFRLHLEECTECRKNVELAKNLNEIMSGMPSIEPPSDFLEQLHKKLPKANRTVRFYRKWQPYTALAACILLAVVIRTNALNDLNDSASYLKNETPAPTAYSGTYETPGAENADVQIADAAENSMYNTATESPAEKTEYKAENKPENKRSTVTNQVIPTVQPTVMPNVSENQAVYSAKTAPLNDSEQVEQSVPSPAANGSSVKEGGSDIGAVNSETNSVAANDLSVSSAALHSDVLTEKNTDIQEQENSAERRISGGGGGGASSCGAASAASIRAHTVNVIEKKYKNEFLKIISELGITKNGNEYTATSGEYEKLLNALLDKDISFDGECRRDGNVVYFTVEWE